MITTNGLNHLALPVKDPERSARFYTELFNMEVTSSSQEVVFLKTVGSWDMIALNRSDSAVASSRDTMHFGFRVDPEQFDAAVTTIQEKSVKTPHNRGLRITLVELNRYAVGGRRATRACRQRSRSLRSLATP